MKCSPVRVRVAAYAPRDGVTLPCDPPRAEAPRHPRQSVDPRSFSEGIEQAVPSRITRAHFAS